MFIVINLDNPTASHSFERTKEEAKDAVHFLVRTLGTKLEDYRIYDTERHVTIKLIPKKKLVWEASCFNVVTHSYKKQLFKSREDGKNWCIMKGAGTLWSENITSGNLHQRLLDWDYSVRARGVQ